MSTFSFANMPCVHVKGNAQLCLRGGKAPPGPLEGESGAGCPGRVGLAGRVPEVCASQQETVYLELQALPGGGVSLIALEVRLVQRICLSQ